VAWSVVQSGANTGFSGTVNFSQATTADNLLIIIDVSNSAGDTCASGGNPLTQGAYSASSGGNFAAVFYLPKCPGGLTSATVTGTSVFAVGYIEVSGADTSQSPATGTATGTGTWNVANPGGSAADFTVFGFTYGNSNAGTPFSDGLTDAVVSNFGQQSYTTTASGSTTASSATNWAAAAASFTPAAAAAGPSPSSWPGRTWLRRFHHPQWLPLAAVVSAPQSGPPLYPLAGPAGTGRRAPLPPRGRTAGNDGTYAQSGPPLYPLRGPVAARRPLAGRGRCQGSQGAPVSAPPPAGAPAPPLHAPVRTRPQPPPKGRTAGNPGARQQTGPPFPAAHGPVQARQPLPRRGRCAGSQGTFTTVVITSGAPLYPLRGPVRTRPQPPPRGRCAGSRGIRHQAGPPVIPLHGPVAPFRPGPQRKGRAQGSPGAYAQAGAPFFPLRKPSRARVPHRPRGGRTAGNAGAPVFIPPFTPGTLTAYSQALDGLTASSQAAAVLTGSSQALGGPS
jgi:hypothetical protein